MPPGSAGSNFNLKPVLIEVVMFVLVLSTAEWRIEGLSVRIV